MLTDDIDHFDTPLTTLPEERIDNYSCYDKKIHKDKRKKLEEYLEAKRLREELSDYTVKKTRTHYEDDIFSDYYSNGSEE